MSRRTGRLLATAAAVWSAGCELQSITLADPEDVVILELILRAGDGVQRALAHRSAGLGSPPPMTIAVSPEGGPGFAFQAAPAEACFTSSDSTMTAVGCYVAVGPDIEPGARYTLRAETADGRTLTGTTRVPGAFEVVVPAATACRLPPDSVIEMTWTSSADSWVYLAETSIEGLGPPLAELGVPLPEDPLRMVGLSISREDSTIVFPAEFGLFDRFDDDLSEVLVLLQGGLPAGASALVVIGAADRNYVNWLRGGNFNPSGTVPVPSVFGAGATGVFGSVVEQRRRMTTAPGTQRPACLP